MHIHKIVYKDQIRKNIGGMVESVLAKIWQYCGINSMDQVPEIFVGPIQPIAEI
jgi:ribulose 1,5-bisphosphate carboxylase large subunit-like protein